MTAPRSPTPFLTLQATAMVVITAAVGAAWWVEQLTRNAEVRHPRELAVEIRRSAAGAVAGPYGYIATRDPARLKEADAAVARVRHQLELLETLVPVASADIQAAQTGVGEVHEALGLMAQASPTTDLARAVTDVDRGRKRLTDAIGRIDALLADGAEAHHDRTAQVLLASWGAALVLVLTTGLTARRRVLTADRTSARALRRSVQALSDGLQRAMDGEDTPPELPENEGFAAANEAVLRAARTLGDLRRRNARLQRSTSFIQDLQDTLIVADTEDEVLGAIQRAALVAYPEASFRVLMLDPRTNSARVVGAEGSPASLDGSRKDPAVQKGRTVIFRGEEGVARGPWAPVGDGPYTSTPVSVNGQIVALLQLYGYKPEATQFEELEALALAMAGRIGVVRSLAERELEAGTDALTGLPNRRAFDARIQALDAAELPYTIVMADLDDFKALNDSWGHDTGDRCLQLFADVLREACRGSDLPCRFGGEEFVILLPDVGMKAGLAVAMRIRAYLAEAVAKQQVQFTVSLGVACRPEHGRTAEAVRQAADRAMYDAKEGGKDQVVPARHSSLS